ncbi:MAG: hypothetical protein M3N56_14835 [Actinomycetota bacterium]|nr:hypothetical protein [Actinomycetota bacterium]
MASNMLIPGGHSHGNLDTATIQRDAEILEMALTAEGFGRVARSRRPDLRRVPRSTTLPWIVAFSISIGWVAADGQPFLITVMAMAAAVFAVYAVGITLEIGLGTQVDPSRVEAFSSGYLLLLLFAWSVAATLSFDKGLTDFAVTHLVPLIVVAALMYARRILGDVRGVVRSMPLIFPVVFIAIFIPLFTQEFWETFGDVNPLQAIPLALFVLGPVLFAVRHQLHNSGGEAYARNVSRLTGEGEQERVCRELSRILRRLPRFTRDVTLAVDFIGYDRWIRGIEPLARLASPESLEEQLRVSRLAEAFASPAPETYAPEIAESLKPTWKQRVTIGLPLLVLTIGGALSLYIYVLTMLAVKTETAGLWAEGTGPRAKLGSVPTADLWLLDIPVGPYVSLSLVGGAVATAIFLAYVLVEDRYAFAVADAVLHSTIERSLLLSVPYHYYQAPHNTWFDKATKVSGTTFTVKGTNVNAVREPGEPDHADNRGGKSVWYMWEAPASSEVTIDTAGSNFDTLLAVYTGEQIDDLKPIASNDDVGRVHTSLVSFSAKAGTVYMIAVDGYRSDSRDADSGAVTLNCSTERPHNDTFAGAEGLIGMTGKVIGTNVNATKEDGEPAHAGDDGGKSIWYVWQAPVTDKVTFDTTGSDFAVLLAVYTGDQPTGDALHEVTSNAGDGSARASSASFEAQAGQIYRIAVDGVRSGATAAAGAVTLTYWTGVPSNAAFANPQVLEGARGAIRGTNVHASKEEKEPQHAENGGGRSVWYEWTAPSSGPATIATEGSSFDTLLAVYTGDDLDALERVGESDDVATGVLTSQVDFDATEGTVYRIAVDGYRDRDGLVADGAIVLSWESPPSNDHFEKAKRIEGAEGAIEDSNIRATKEPGEPRHAGNRGGSSVWYAWTAPVTGRVLFNAVESGFETLLAAYTGDSLDKAKKVSSEGGSLSDTTSLLAFGVRAGVEYRIAVDGCRTGDRDAEQGRILLRWKLDTENDADADESSPDD